MEGPSLKIAKEQLKPFKGKIILKVSGNTKIGKEKLLDLNIKDIFSWGKHLVFQFEPFAMRVHFMLFGTFEAVINGKKVTGDYKRVRIPRLELQFENGTISMFNCSIKYIEEKKLKSSYDFSVDLMSSKWDGEKAYKKILNCKNDEIADVILDQDIFAGAGNIIKNEVLGIVKVNPQTLVGTLSPRKLKEIVKAVHEYSKQFYIWRKKFVLRKHYKIYQKSTCPHCGGKVTRKKTGKRARWSFYCPQCQRYKLTN